MTRITAIAIYETGSHPLPRHAAERRYLVIWKLDRLGRSLRDLLEIVERLENSGVQFLSLTEDINTKAASGRLILHVFAGIGRV
jgi:DNA invertase Pin-like site-specific DNA recombinase